MSQLQFSPSPLKLLPQSIGPKTGREHSGDDREEYREPRIVPQGVQCGEVVLNRNLAPLGTHLFDQAIADHIHSPTFRPQRDALNGEFVQPLQADGLTLVERHTAKVRIIREADRPLTGQSTDSLAGGILLGEVHGDRGNALKE